MTLNTYILQAFQPLNFLGSIYRQIRQSLIDMESLFDILDESGESDPATHQSGSRTLKLLSMMYISLMIRVVRPFRNFVYG